jgi:glycosyltransferase involved in cell wall biosynthesis
MTDDCAVSVVISTYNRGPQLSTALDVLLTQGGGVGYEIIVVDNNSTDNTRNLVLSRMAGPGGGILRYVFEPKQGLPHARNAGILAARAPIIAFTDDDVYAANDWVAAIKRAFDEHPEVDCIGGPVLPSVPERLPGWTSNQYGPLAIQDKGDRKVLIGPENASPCLIGANFSFRRSAFEKAGFFSPDYPRTQDRELQLRLWKAGGRGLYVPDVVVMVDVPEERLIKEYFRSWYARVGRYHSRMEYLDVIDRDGRLVDPPPPEARLFGVPAFLYAQLASSIGRWLIAKLRLREADAFFHENRVRYLANYVIERWRSHRRAQAGAAIADIARFARWRLTRRRPRVV